MIKDPKQIVTPFAFEVHPDLLGLPLATPRRRLVAFSLDLLIASILTVLGAFFLAISASILFFWLAIRNRGNVWWKNFFRYGMAGFVSILIFALTYSLTDNGNEDSVPDIITFNSPSGEVIKGSTDQVDWGAIAKEVTTLSKNDSLDIEDQLEQIAEDLEKTLLGETELNLIYPPYMFKEDFILNLSNLAISISKNDTVAIDTLRKQITPVLASSELSSKDERISKLRSTVDRLEENNDELTQQVENPSFIRTLRAIAEDFGLSIGWIGIYFVLCLALFEGQTLGKRLLKLRVVRLNNKPIGLFYSFERFGGYAAGIATGLLGFAQIYWDSNRQAIHDKIAATVVLDIRKKTIEKYEALRTEIISKENLIDDHGK